MITFVTVTNVVGIGKMIKARRLFFIPAISAFLCLIPIVGLFIWLLVIAHWYTRNQVNIHQYFKGQNYYLNETSEENLNDLK